MRGEAPCSWHLETGTCVGEKETRAQRQEVRHLSGRMPFPTFFSVLEQICINFTFKDIHGLNIIALCEDSSSPPRCSGWMAWGRPHRQNCAR